MYVFMYICMYACMHVCMKVCICVCMHECVYVCCWSGLETGLRLESPAAAPDISPCTVEGVHGNMVKLAMCGCHGKKTTIGDTLDSGNSKTTWTPRDSGDFWQFPTRRPPNDKRSHYQRMGRTGWQVVVGVVLASLCSAPLFSPSSCINYHVEY